jgi:hypothetical protein
MLPWRSSWGWRIRPIEWHLGVLNRGESTYQLGAVPGEFPYLMTTGIRDRCFICYLAGCLAIQAKLASRVSAAGPRRLSSVDDLAPAEQTHLARTARA